MTGTDTVAGARPVDSRTAPPVAGNRRPRTARPVLLLWRREMTRLRHNPARVLLGLVTPLLFLVVLGTGLESASSTLGRAQLEDYRAFLFPGALVMSVQSPAIAVGISLVWDRRLGILRQMLVAPVPRSQIVLGLAAGGATVGGVYGIGVLAVGGIAGIRPSPMLLVVLAEILCLSLFFTSLGLLAAVTIRRVDTFQIVVNLGLMPLMFFSGAMFPPNGLPGWLDTVVKANPLTYGVDAVRRTLPGPRILHSEQTRLLIGGWNPPVVAELGALAGLTAVCLAVSTVRFSRAS